MNVPERSAIPLLPALMLGFTCGIIVSALQMTPGGRWAVGIAGGLVVLGVGFASVAKQKADKGERLIVGALRAVLSAAIFTFVYLAIHALLIDGLVPLFLVWIVLAGVCTFFLIQQRVRDRAEHTGSGADDEGEDPSTDDDDSGEAAQDKVQEGEAESGDEPVELGDDEEEARRQQPTAEQDGDDGQRTDRESQRKTATASSE